jgi:hypothetical protein
MSYAENRFLKNEEELQKRLVECKLQLKIVTEMFKKDEDILRDTSNFMRETMRKNHESGRSRLKHNLMSRYPPSWLKSLREI